MITTDNHIAKLLTDQRVDVADVRFLRDYSVEFPTTKIYRNNKTGLYIASCQALPKVNPDGIKICGENPNETLVGWILQGGKYLAKPNVFTCSVDGLAIELISLGSKFTTRGQTVGWEPQVYLNGVAQHCGAPTVLLIDPTNSNYHNNVIEWNYGCCVRRLRQIEGFISDRHIVFSNPHGEVRVKLNQSGDLKLHLSGAVDAAGNSLGRVEGDCEIVSKEELDKAVYPVILGADLTVYSTSNDGYAGIPLTEDTWNNVRAANGTTRRDNATADWAGIGYWSVNKFQCSRGLFPFDVSAAFGGTVLTGTFSLYFSSITEKDAGASDFALVEGVQQSPIVDSDYEAHYTKTTEGSASRMLHPQSLVAYTVLTLDADGIGWVQTALDGSTEAKFCIRIACDIDGVPEPTGNNSAQVFQNEQGAGFQPRLVITYIPRVEDKSANMGAKMVAAGLL